MNENNDREGDDNRREEEARVHLAIESLDDYVRRYGLQHANENEQDGGEFNGLNRTEALERVRAEEAYRDQVIERHQSQNETPPDEHDAPLLDKNGEGTVISVLLADKSIHIVSVHPLVAYCDTVKRMVSSWLRLGVRYGVADDEATTADVAKDNTNIHKMSSQEEKEDSTIQLSLVEFEPEATLQFIDVLVSLHSTDNKQIGSSETPPKRHKSGQESDNATSNHIMNLINEGKISEQNIVECVKLAHFLQCNAILDVLTSILEQNIDSNNCMSMCSLADALNLKSLFETSVNFVIERLDALQGTSDNANEEGKNTKRSSSSGGDENDDLDQEPTEEIWASLPYELRSRVLTMRNVMRSSVIGRGSKVSGLFFSSGNEFLAIFRETIRDSKERLAEARERHHEVVRERTEEWVIMCQRRGRWFDRSVEAKDNFVNGADVKYALDKIEKQSRRIATLESFYEEQKTIFKGGGFASEIRL